MKPIWWKTKGGFRGPFLGIECGRFTAPDFSGPSGSRKHLVLLRDGDKREHVYEQGELKRMLPDEVKYVNKCFEEIGIKPLPVTPEPIRKAKDVFQPYIWCSKCGKDRSGNNVCPTCGHPVGPPGGILDYEEKGLKIHESVSDTRK